MVRRFSAVLLAWSVVLATSAAQAGPAEEYVKARESELRALVERREPRAKVDALFDQFLDYDAIARESLGKDWEGLDEAKRKEFTELLTRLVRTAYRKNLEKTAGYAVEYKGESEAAQGRLVMTVARSRTKKREEPVSIDYVVVSPGDGHRVVDIVTEGSSLVANYRSQFRKIIKKEGFPALLEKMKKKLAKG